MDVPPKVSASSAFDKLRRVPKDPGVNVTLIGALSQRGLDALMTIAGATTGDVFLAYVEQVLGPRLRPGDVVMMDTLRAHKVSGVAEAIASRGAEVVYLPPYSPDLSPIEACWSKLKACPRLRPGDGAAQCEGTHV